MKNILLIDFGSTYTKVTAVDVENQILLGTAASYTTVATDINEGLTKALEELEKKVGEITYEERYACSSAAGGLRMIAAGLVPELTSEAAKQASLGAGAKVIKVYAFELTEEDIEEIELTKPEIFLLVGGTDGGNSQCIIHNAEMLANSKANFQILLAGNRNAVGKCREILQKSGKDCEVVENVMPKFGVLNIKPAQDKIRDLFLKRIISAKGLSEASGLISGIMMPTPSAMMKAMELLAKGIGELLGIDVGGATTDIYSIADGSPKGLNVVYKGLPEPYIKRTVEGDIGMRYSLQGIVEGAGIQKIAELSELTEEKTEEMIEYLKKHTDMVPEDALNYDDPDDWFKLDYALASCAIEIAVMRHAGTIEEVYTPAGLTYSQAGKDLTDVKQIIVTGGSLIHTKKTEEIASHALYNPTQPISLRPKKAKIIVDRSYILATMGLLAEKYPEVALKIMKKELNCNGN